MQRPVRYQPVMNCPLIRIVLLGDISRQNSQRLFLKILQVETLCGIEPGQGLGEYFNQLLKQRLISEKAPAEFLDLSLQLEESLAYLVISAQPRFPAPWESRDRAHRGCSCSERESCSGDFRIAVLDEQGDEPALA